MKFLHTADLHIGKVVNDFSMLEDQKYMLNQIRDIAVEKKADGVLLAGDIYDRAIPPGEAVTLLDTFLTELAEAGISVYLISGNHDSPERLSFGTELFKRQGVVIGGRYQGKLPAVEREDEWGKVEIVLLPFLKPSQLEAKTTQEAVGKALERYWQEQEKTDKKRRVLLTHYFVTDAGKEPELSDSETTIHVGGLDNVDASLFEGFDYVALGHIHKPQQIGKRPVYYAGSPLKYSFGETQQEKSVLLVTLPGEGACETERVPLKPLREMRKIKGSLASLLCEGADREDREDYIQAVLTDREELIDPIGSLRSVYPNVMQIIREEKEEKHPSFTAGCFTAAQKDPVSLFEEFYCLVKEETLSEEEKELVSAVIKEESGNRGLYEA